MKEQMERKDLYLQNAAKALGKLPSGLCIVCVGDQTKPRGFLASWIQQASFSPLRLSIAIAKNRELNQVLSTAGTVFSVNILDKESSSVMKAFFGKGNPFEQIKWEWREPLVFLPEALALLHCHTVSKLEAGDHDLLLADVVDGNLLREGTPLVHTRNSALNY